MTGGRSDRSDKARFAAFVEAGERHLQQLEWTLAGGAFVEAARVAVDSGALPSARQVLTAAGEAFRRDDRPADAARALRMAASYPRVGDAAEATVDLLLGSVCGDLGEVQESFECLERAEKLLPAQLRPVWLDSRIGLILGHRRKADARPLVAALRVLGGAAGVAASFREGQLARLDGDLGRAGQLQQGVLSALSQVEGAGAGLAGARMELAELDLLAGEPNRALERAESARQEHLAAGRHSLALRAEAARTRAAVKAGLSVFPGPLEEGLRFARDRGMVLLEIDLQIAIAAALGALHAERAREVSTAAARAADRYSAPLLAGRARLILATLCEGSERRAIVAQARLDLVDHEPLSRQLDAL